MFLSFDIKTFLISKEAKKGKENGEREGERERGGRERERERERVEKSITNFKTKAGWTLAKKTFEVIF